MNQQSESRARTRSWHATWLVFLAMLLCRANGYAQPGPQPPCGEGPLPAYPGLDDAPNVKVWNESALGHDWQPPACTGWSTAGFTTLVTTAARFRYAAGAEGLRRNIGAISKLAGMRYWSSTHKRWQTLVVTAHALTGPQPGQRRPDFTPDEVTDGTTLYFAQSDNVSGDAIYRMLITKASTNQIIFEVENVSIIRYSFVTLFPPSAMQTIYFLDRQPDNVWRYYSIARTGRNASRLASGHASSSINRTVAYYRFLAGIPTDQEPPAAR